MLITINRESKCNIRQVPTLIHGIVVKSESKHSSKIVRAKAIFVCFSRMRLLLSCQSLAMTHAA